MLKQEYKEDELTLADAKKLAIRVLSKTLDMTKLTSEKGNIGWYKLPNYINMWNKLHIHQQKIESYSILILAYIEDSQI